MKKRLQSYKEKSASQALVVVLLLLRHRYASIQNWASTLAGCTLARAGSKHILRLVGRVYRLSAQIGLTEAFSQHFPGLEHHREVEAIAATYYPKV